MKQLICSKRYNLVASTTWFYAKEGFEDSASFDYLIIDEAGLAFVDADTS